MKKLTLFLISIVLFGCSSSSDSEEEEPQGQCGTVTITNVTQNFETLTISWQSQGNFNYFEIGYDATSNISGPINNNNSNTNSSLPFSNLLTTSNSSSASDEANAEELNFYAQQNETFSFYIRAQCANGQFTNWNGPFILQLDEFCEKPYDLNIFADQLSWSFNGFAITNASYFQVEYGLQGFQLGNGSQSISNDMFVDGFAMEQGNAYDFYVRAFCENNLGWGDWAGPISYFAEQDFNLCNPPSNLQYFVEFISGSSAGVRFEWDYNGETEFEHVLVSNNADPSTGNISTSDTFGWPVYTGLSTFADYDFYVRGVCNDGTRTAWAGPLDVNP
ncbi:hypothetical protein AB9K26_05460 [Psychroserpens sp. XS_ASV72]|uniref:hypothetical protein n=1 Tax=Psychroserpens sp. XS_ASV72 TaxID=3241293 RepID=UPI00351898D4